MAAVKKPISPGPSASHISCLGRKIPTRSTRCDGARAHQLDALALGQLAVHHAHQHHDAEIKVVPAINQQRFQRRIRIAARRGQAGDDSLKHLIDAKAGLGGNLHSVGGVQADHVLDLLADAVRLGGGQVDLVENRNDLVIVVERLVDVGERLRFHALAGVHHQQRTLARGQAARDFVGEVHMAGRVDQIELIGFAVLAPCSRAAPSAP